MNKNYYIWVENEVLNNPKQSLKWAEVNVNLYFDEENVKEVLEDAFSKIWDDPMVRCMSQAEYEKAIDEAVTYV